MLQLKKFRLCILTLFQLKITVATRLSKLLETICLQIMVVYRDTYLTLPILSGILRNTFFCRTLFAGISTSSLFNISIQVALEIIRITSPFWTSQLINILHQFYLNFLSVLCLINLKLKKTL